MGRAVFHTIAGRPQISGADVILAHRLLKNSLPNREYLLMTEPAHRELGREMSAASPFVIAYIALVQPGRLRARHAAERLRGASLR